MKKFLCCLAFGVFTLLLLTACTGTGEQGTPTAPGTTVPGEQTVTPFAVGTDTTEIIPTGTTPGIETPAVNLTATIPTATNIEGAAQTPGLPVTGADLILLEGQFCIADIAHALLLLPDTAAFETVADAATLSTPGPDMGCKTVDRYNGRQIVICRGQQNTSLNLNICVDGNNCTPLLVELQSCPQAGATQSGAAATDTSGAGALTETPGVVIPTSTTGVGVTDTPAVVSPTP
jgi:hypothetical protein